MKSPLTTLIIAIMLLAGCTATPTPAPTPVSTSTPTPSAANMPNPASQYCVEQGGRVEIRTTEKGEVGYCIFPDGSECEEWAFFRGECKPGKPAPGMVNPASKYCIEHGGKLEIRTTEKGEAGYCIFPDGSECEEWAFFRGECKPGQIKPTATPEAGKASRIQFEPGATSASVSGKVPSQGTVEYRLRAKEGQFMMVVLGSSKGNVFLGIVGEDGTPLLRPAAETTFWMGVLPATQDYTIQIAAPEEGDFYDLSITIPVWIKPSSETGSATVQGKAKAHQVVDYVLYGEEGQTMEVAIKSPDNDVLLSITALEEGIPLVRAVAETTQWSGTLPATGHYLIQAFASGEDTTYTVEVTLR